MLTRQLLTVVAVCSGLLLGIPSIAGAQDEPPQPSAGELYVQGMDQFEQGELEEARQLLRAVDHMQLPPNQRVRLFQTLQEIDRRTQDAADEPAPADADAADAEPEPEPTPAELLAAARQRAGSDPGEAGDLYRQVLNHEDADEAQREQAGANLAQIRRQINRDLTIARQQIDLAGVALERGDHEDAISRLELVQDNAGSLGWFDRQRLERQLTIAQGQQADANAERERLAEEARQAEQDRVAAAQQDENDTDDGGEAERAAAAEREAELERAAEAERAAAEDRTAEAERAAEQERRAEAQRAADAERAADDLMSRARTLRLQERLAEGRAAEEAGNTELAIRHYQQAQELEPDNGVASERLAALEARRQQDLAPTDALQRQRVDDALIGQQAVADANEALNNARSRFEAGDYVAAREAVDRARQSLDRNRRVLDAETYEDLRSSAESLAIRIQDQQTAEELRVQREATRQARAQREADRRRAMRAEQEQIHDLLTRAMEMRLEMRYDRALELVDRALNIDPNNIAAQAMKLGIEDSQALTSYHDQQRGRNVRIAQQAVLNIEATQPYTELVRYPPDWPELTVRRLEAMEDQMGESPANRRVQTALREPLPVDFSSQRLVSVIDYFRNATDQNFFVNWRALEAAGIDQNTPITLQLQNVPADQALRLVMQQASSDFDPVRYSVVDGVIHISTETDLRQTTDTRVYDIRDLLVQVPNFDNAPRFDLESVLEQGGSDSDASSIFESDAEELEYMTREEMIEQIEDMIVTTVGRLEDWDDIARFQEYNGNLIIRATSAMHRELIELLAQLRETRAIQISVEARFLLVDQHFMENIGVDFDFELRNLGGNFGPIGVAQDSITLADRATNDTTPGRFTEAGPAGPVGTFVPGSGFVPGLTGGSEGRALNMGVSYLDDLQVNLIVHATQASQRSVSLTAPRVTFFNGQRAYVIVAQQHAFVSELEPVPDAVGFIQTLSIVNEGVVLDVEGTVSADRRYVTMTLQPSLANLAEIRQLEQTFAFTIGSDDNEQTIFASAFIEAPSLELTSVAATVSVPDKGTLLLGGQRLVDEVEVEAGVPVLSKIPFLNRLFTNTSNAKDERTLLILIKPSIIIQQEEEDINFPGLNENPTAFDQTRR